MYHQGSMAGYTATIVLLPQTESAIVVLTNSEQLNEASDWIAQLLVETLLDSPDRNDYVALAEESAKSFVAKFPAMEKAFEKERVVGTSPKPLQSYIGRYYNSIRNFFLEIRLQQDSLHLSFQGRDSQVWKMRHLHYDTFIWLMTRDESISRARFSYAPKDSYKLEFQADDKGQIKSVLWLTEFGSPPERFERLDDSSQYDLGTAMKSISG